jgi:dTMP kinase
MNIGKFIVVDGFFGSGKSSVIRKLKETFTDAVFVKEPGSTYEGKEIKKILNSTYFKLEIESHNVLFMASLIEASRKVIEPALKEGRTVFSERWYSHIRASQIYPNGHKSKYVDSIIEECNISHPDIVILLYTPFEVCLKRLSKKKASKKVLDKGQKYLRDVYNYYYTECPGIQIDGNRNISSIVSDVLMVVKYGNE